MDVITVVCPKCGGAYKIRPEHVGRKARCGKCATVFVVQGSGREDNSSAREPTALVACRYCGFQDAGNFCSNCGARLSGKPAYGIRECMVPAAYIQALPSHFVFDMNATPDEQQRLDSLAEKRRKCEEFNDYLAELARELELGDPNRAPWRWDRVNLGRMVDQLPADVPGRDRIISSLWTIVSDIERQSDHAHFEKLVADTEAALQDVDLKVAEKTFKKLRAFLGEARVPDAALTVERLRTGLELLRAAASANKRTAEFQKLLDKAEKLVFQSEWKKAVKAYQECLFWLSRNEHPDADRLRSEVEKQMEECRRRDQA